MAICKQGYTAQFGTKGLYENRGRGKSALGWAVAGSFGWTKKGVGVMWYCVLLLCVCVIVCVCVCVCILRSMWVSTLHAGIRVYKCSLSGVWQAEHFI